MYSEDSLNQFAKDLYTAYWQAAKETGWCLMTPAPYDQQDRTIQQLWKTTALKSARFFAERPSAN